MQKRKFIFIGLPLGLLIILLAATYSYIKNQEHLTARHHLLCEVLKPGMSVDEVLGILHRAGNFTMSKAEWRGGDIELGVNFIDPKGEDLYGGFELRFYDYKYAQAYISNFDYLEIICDFSQVIKAATATSRPSP
jgi:hypothetical protein